MEAVNDHVQVRKMFTDPYDVRFYGAIEFSSTVPLSNLDAQGGAARRMVFVKTKAKARNRSQIDPSFKARMTSPVEIARWFEWLKEADLTNVKPCPHLQDASDEEMKNADKWQAHISQWFEPGHGDIRSETSPTPQRGRPQA